MLACRTTAACYPTSPKQSSCSGWALFERTSSRWLPQGGWLPTSWTPSRYDCAPAMILTTRGSSSGFWLRQLMRLELPPKDPAAEENIAVDWVTNNWREDRDTRAAVAVLARLGMTHFDWDLGLFVVLEDEWNGRWG